MRLLSLLPAILIWLLCALLGVLLHHLLIGPVPAALAVPLIILFGAGILFPALFLAIEIIHLLLSTLRR